MNIINLNKVEDNFLDDEGNIVLKFIEGRMYKYENENYYVYKEYNKIIEE